MGKATMLNNFYQYAEFIGCLHKAVPHNNIEGFLAFIRLVGTCYFKKHLAVFASLYEHQTPIHLFNSLDHSLDPLQRHEKWLQAIRAVVNNRITNEEEMVPSFTSLCRHWLHTCWEAQLWKASASPDVYASPSPPEQSGWIHQPDGTYAIDWEEEEVQKSIQHQIDFLLKGCGCKKGCTTLSCGCRKKKICGPGCLCQGCTNLQQNSNSVVNIVDDVHSSSSSDSNGSDSDSDNYSDDNLVTEVITDDLTEFIDLV